MDICLGYLRTHLTYARSYVALYNLQELRLASLVGFSLCSLQPTDFVTFEIEGIEKWCNNMLIVCQPIMFNRSMCKRLFIWIKLFKSLKSYSDLCKCCVSFASWHRKNHFILALDSFINVNITQIFSCSLNSLDSKAKWSLWYLIPRICQ